MLEYAKEVFNSLKVAFLSEILIFRQVLSNLAKLRRALRMIMSEVMFKATQRLVSVAQGSRPSGSPVGSGCKSKASCHP